VGLGDRNGVLVVAVPAASKAARIGLKENDVVRAVNGQQAKSLRDFADLYRKQARSGALTLKLWRDQAEVPLEVPPQ